MSNTIIPAGYRLTVRSWENDADNYNTEVLEGLTREKVTFYVALANLFESSNRHTGGIGNMYEPDDEELAKIAEAGQKLFEQFPDMAPEKDDDEMMADRLTNLASEIGLARCSEFHTRVLDTLKVEHISAPIELNDVTKEFK